MPSPRRSSVPSSTERLAAVCCSAPLAALGAAWTCAVINHGRRNENNGRGDPTDGLEGSRESAHVHVRSARACEELSMRGSGVRGCGRAVSVRCCGAL